MKMIRVNNLMRFLFCGMMLFGMALAAAPNVEVFVTPQPVRTGEPAWFVIRSADGTRNQPLNNRLPAVKELQWQHGISQSSRISIVNGRRTAVFEAKIPFVVSQPGTYTIPAMTLTHSKEKSKPVTFTAVEASYRVRSASGTSAGRQTVSALPRPSGTANTTPKPSSAPSEPQREAELSLEQIMFMDAEIPGKRAHYYLGEEIPLEINIYVLAGMQPQLSWPSVAFEGKSSAVFHDYSKVNPDNPQFEGATPQMVQQDGRNYVRYSFRTAVRPISAGTLALNIKEDAALLIPDSRRARSNDFFDDFFDDPFFSRTRRVVRNMTVPALKAEILKLPEAAAGEQFTGLVGNWQTRVTLSPPPYRVGEPITLKIEYQGGSAETLRTWPLSLKGFRTYPPEVEKNVSGAEVRYMLIPTESADGKMENVVFGPFSTFDPTTQKYQTQTFRQSLTVEKGNNVISGGSSQYEPVSFEPAEKGKETVRRQAEDILYLKKTDSRPVLLPLLRNAIVPGILLILPGLLFLVFILVFRSVRNARANDPGYQRRAAARSRKSELLARIRQLPSEEIPAECSGDIASYLADSLGLPPGADLNECSAALKTRSPQLARMLDELSQAAWMPSMKNRFTPEFRSSLIRLLGRLSVLLLLLFAPSLSGAETLENVQPLIRSWEAAMNAYDAGDFRNSGWYYTSKANPAAPSANMLYNAGNCLYKQGRLPQSLVCYERASRLAPRDSDIQENLNLVRRKLGLAEKYQVQSPSDIPAYLRDSLRPDEWVLLFCAGISLLLICGGIWIQWGTNRTFRYLLVIGLLCLILPGTAYLSQQKTTYNPAYAVVIARSLPVYSLPSDRAGKAEMTLKAGEELVIVEHRMDWVRIRSGAAEGWVHADGIASLWSPDGRSGN